MPKILRTAQLTIDAAELSKMLGVPFTSIQEAQRYPNSNNEGFGLKLTVSIEEEMALPKLALPKKT